MDQEWGMESLDEVPPEELKDKIKVFINGDWAGCFHASTELVSVLRDLRRNCDISPETSIVFDIVNRVSGGEMRTTIYRGLPLLRDRFDLLDYFFCDRK